MGSKGNAVWIWIALESKSTCILAVVFGDPSEQTAQRLFESLPAYYQQNGIFFTDSWPAYNVLPNDQHFVIDNATNHIEPHRRTGFNCTLRQRCSNLVRKTLSFSKSLAMHQRLRPTAFVTSSITTIRICHSEIYHYLNNKLLLNFQNFKRFYFIRIA